MNKSKTMEIIKFSFYKDMRNKWFIIFNALTLISMLIMFNFGSISSIFKSTEDKHFNVEVLDNENLIYDTFKNEFSSDDKKFEVSRIYENNYTAENIPDNLIVVEASSNDKDFVKFSIISKEGIKTSKYSKIKDALNVSRNKLFAENSNLTNEQLELFQSDLDITRIMLAVNAEDSTTKDYIKMFSAALTYMIAILIFSKISNEISQEKQSKSSEYILTTVSEKEYLFAKIFSTIVLVIIQGLLLLIYYYIGALSSSVLHIATTDLSLSSSIIKDSVNSDIIYYILSLLIYNVLNLVFLCIIQATLAAKTSSSSEAGNTTSLTSFIMLVSYIIATVVITPYSKVNILLEICSCLPVLSAYFIPALMVIGQIKTWQIVLSLILLIISIPVTFNYCAKWFKNGILDYTKVKKKKNQDEKEKLDNFIEKRKVKNLGFVIGLGILLYVSIQTVLSLVFTFALPALLGSILTDTEITLINQILLQVFSLGIASLFVLSYSNGKTERRKIKSSNKAQIVLIALFLVFVLQIVLSFTLYPSLGLDYNVTDMFDVDSNSSALTKVILVLSLAVTPAIFEELFFRKAVIDFSMPYGKNFALVFSALIFGILHMNISQGLFAFIMGLIMGAIYIYTGDLKLTMLIHFLNNGYAAVAMFAKPYTLILITLTLFVLLIIGFASLIKVLIKKEYREKIKSILFTDISKKSFEKYKYVFTDFAFDVSVILIVLMSILTEKILR